MGPRLAAWVVAVACLWQAGSPRADELSGLVRSLASDPSARVRVQAALALSPRAGEPDVVQALVRALYDRDALVRATAAKALLDAAPARAFVPLAVTALDSDTLVSKWAIKALRRVLARVPVVTVDLRGLETRLDVPTDAGDKAFQEAVLEALVAAGRFTPDQAMDFVEGAKPEDAPEARLDIRGHAVEVPSADGSIAVRATLKAVTPSGFVAWEGASVGTAPRPGTEARDPDADEYTRRPTLADRRLDALREAARALGASLANGLGEGGEERPGLRSGR
jgi:hypothetical protein